MTNIELENAKHTYYTNLQGQKKLLEYLEKYPSMQVFLNTYFINANIKNIESISSDEILRNAFLLNFHKTEERGNFMVYINHIKKMNNTLSDGQPTLESIDLDNLDFTKDDLNIYKLYCNLENNQPFLVGKEDIYEFTQQNHEIFLPDYTPKKENYEYHSNSLEWISKGGATESFNRLQLYYFRQLLETSREDAYKRIKTLISNF